MEERVPGRRRVAAARVAVELLEHGNEGREAGARSHHQDVLEVRRALGQGEIPHDALYVGEPVVLLRFDPSEERLGEPAQHSVLSLLEHDVVLGRFTESLLDRKSTRLNSSHLVISYAVLCLKKKEISTENGGNSSSLHVGII